MRRELGIADDRFVIGAVGRLVSLKGFHVLIEAMGQVKRDIPDAKLVIVGDGDPDYEQRLHEQARAWGVESMICWAGFRSDIPQVLGAYDLYVLPSLDESLPLSVIEAMASARPVVATTVSGVPECVVQDTTGELVPPGNAATLARAIIKLAQYPDLARQYAKAGRQRVLDEFSFAGQTNRIEELLQNIAEKNS